MAETCPNCGGPLIQKSRPRLLLAGIVLLPAPALAFFSAKLWLPGIVGTMTGVYLIYWATAGRGRWCRQCKIVPR